MKKLMYGGSLTALLVAMGIAAPSLAATADATATATADTTADATSSTATVSEVTVTTGTRVTGVTAADSAAPVQVVGAQALIKTGAVDLASSLETAVPALNIDANGGDMAALSIEASLRGLSPNDTLVLIDGKRRHRTANFFVDTGSAYTGAAAVDLSFIPVDAIDHVEVLTDGAAAQYGSDAIAGVVNVILKHNNDSGIFDGAAGQYYMGQGATASWGLNKGIMLGDKGFLSVTLEERYHDFTNLGIGDRRLQNPDGTVHAGLTFPSSNVSHALAFPHENQLNGDPAFNLYNIEANMGYDITPDLQFYGFATAGYRLAGHYENYRVPTKVSGVTSLGATVFPLPFGFDPQEQIKELDGSITVGLKGKLAEWNFDLSTTYGVDTVDVWVINSANAQLFPALQALSPTPITPQRNFHNGQFQDVESTTTLDLDRGFDIGAASPLNVAWGFEARHETYSITAGEPSSYFGAGAQSFDGYTPQDQAQHDRTNYAGYLDFAVDPVTGLHLDLAGRYEHYSDFGSATVGKFTARYDFNPAFALRGTVSTGFRAPTMAEEFYSGTNVSPTSAAVSLPPNSPSALLAGFGPLKPEKSTNFSIGFVAHPVEHMQLTLDAYDIELKNRIVETGFIYGTFQFDGNPAPSLISPGVLNAIASRGVTLDSGLSYTGIQLFTNGADTRTLGVDFTANYASDFDEWGHVDWTAGFNYNKTDLKRVANLPAAVSTVTTGQIGTLGQFGPILNAVAISSLLDETPKWKAILQALWTKGPFSANLRLDLYGPESLDVQSGSGLFVEKISTTGIVDLDLGYKFTDKIKFDIGADNLFDTRPPLTPLVGGTPIDGALVYHVPYTFAPWGSNGGYYYGRLTVTF